MTDTTTTSGFDFVWELTDALKKAAKKPLAKRKLRRQFQAAFDSLVEQHDSAVEQLTELRNSIPDEGYDVQRAVALSGEIKTLVETMDVLNAEHKALFGDIIKKAE